MAGRASWTTPGRAAAALPEENPHDDRHDSTDTSTDADRTAPPLDMDALMAFVFRAVDEVGATLNCALVVMGDRLGYYRALADHGPLDAADLARRTSTGERYAAEWLNAQAAGGFVTYDPATRAYTLPAEHAVALTDESSPAFLPGLLPDRLRHRPRRRPDLRPRPRRRRARLGRAQQRRAQRLRALLPARVRRPPGRRVAARPGRRRRQARAGRPGPRPRLRPRRLDRPDGPGLPGVGLRRLRRARPLDRDRPAAGRRGRRRRPHPVGGGPGHRARSGPATTW